MALGNNRPPVLVKLEDCVLRAIIAIYEGKSPEVAIDDLHLQIPSLEKDLLEDDEALHWFKLSAEDVSTHSPSQPSEVPSTPSAISPLPSKCPSTPIAGV